MATTPAANPDLLRELGRTVREQRRASALTLKELASRSGLSTRFLGDLEAGRGNISIVRLAQVAGALQTPIELLLRDAENRSQSDKTALVGLRGAGKTTVGEEVAKQISIPFVELDRKVEERAGMALSDLFSLHGEPYYRRLERETLREVLSDTGAVVIATGGGIINDTENWKLLRDRCHTVWLEATPDDHWNRVVAQGDQRPMKGNPEAKKELEEILRERAPLYSMAHERLDTSEAGLEKTVDQVKKIVTRGVSAA